MAKGRKSFPDRPDSRIEHEALIALSVLASAAPPGKLVEVGVYQGGSAWHLYQVAERQGRELHLFDTFKGIPDKDTMDTHLVGDYGDTSAAEIQKRLPQAVLHVGIFPETLPPELDGLAFVHVDCDQRSGHLACIDHLYPRMVVGGIMLFDDYPRLPGAEQAVHERFAPERLIFTGYRHHVVKV